MSDSDLLDQISNFLFAGSDSTSLAVAWCMHYLSLNPGFQTRLRDELISASPSSSSSSDGTFDDPSAAIEALPLLDAVIKETLRIAPPAHGTIRVATQDDVIPVSAPVVTRNGRATSEIRIRKGSYVHIPIEGLNLSKDIWGEDAQAFKCVLPFCTPTAPANGLPQKTAQTGGQISPPLRASSRASQTS